MSEQRAAFDGQPIVLVTGVSGTIGSAVARTLADRYHVVGLDRDGIDPDAEDCFRIDLADDSSVAQALERVRERYGDRIAAVVHLAAYFDFTGEPHPLYEQVNIEGTRRLLHGLQRFSVERFVYSSTMLVHAPGKPGIALTERSPLAPKWPYPQSKLAAEQVIEHERGAIPTTCLRMAGIYHDRCGSPTLAHQIQRIYERSFKSYIYAGKTSRGQSFLHLDDAVRAIVSTVDRRADHPANVAILVGERAVLSYEALQNLVGQLVHGESWPSISVPRPLAAAGAWLEDVSEPVVPDAIDGGERPFIKPFMVAMAEDHYELDTSKAEQWLDWRPRHRLREFVPTLVEGLMEHPGQWYRANGLRMPAWLDAAETHAEPQGGSAGELLERSRARYLAEFQRNLWAPLINLGIGSWLLTSPPILGHQEPAMAWSDAISGAVVMVLALLALSPARAWARWGCAAVGTWLLMAPLIFWTQSPGAYLNDTLAGALVIGLAILVKPVPGIDPMAAIRGPDIPSGWDYCPSSWEQRLPIIMLAFVGLYVSRYLAAYQLGHTEMAWDPFFAQGTEQVITSSVSKAWPVPDAGVGAVTYMLEILTGILGGRARWRTMPWLVMLFGLMIIPLGAVSIFFIIIQPIVIGTWCSLCLLAAAAMLLQIPYSFDELFATIGFLKERRRSGRNLLVVFFRGDAGPVDTDDPERNQSAGSFQTSPYATFGHMLGGGLSVTTPLLISVLIGLALMCSRLLVDTAPPLAHADHLLGALIVTVSVASFAEVARWCRFINILLGMAVIASPMLFEGVGVGSMLLDICAGSLLILVSVPRGRIHHTYGEWNRYLI
ncbi:MAG: NAD-dependent epimerase/dehydratase family protein [Gammaproteobacteria bacterium]|nr:NAD-dependent epimerase/dehydratase family protein [Gammaproteobacteria bacterium]